MVAGLPAGSVGYVTYSELASLARTPIEVHDDENFPRSKSPHGLGVTGIPLDTLARALDVLPGSDLIDATCTDDYRAHYPAAYIAAHSPVLGLTINRQRPEEWAKRFKQYDPGPYFITHARFVPAFRVLSHADQPQIPTNVIRLNFSTVGATFGSIAPRGNLPPSSPEQQGFAIATQNCLRCHSQGPYGGTKSGLNWSVLSTWAREQPAFFAKYVHDPKVFDPHANMPPNPEYDAPTLAALTAYFRTFTEGQRGSTHAHAP